MALQAGLVVLAAEALRAVAQVADMGAKIAARGATSDCEVV